MGEPIGGTRFSVYDVTRGLNFVLRQISNNLPRTASELKSIATLAVTSGQCTLPLDFLALNSVWNGNTKLTQVVSDEPIQPSEYDIYGDTMVFSTSVTSITLYYKAQLVQLDASAGAVPAGNFPLPDFYCDLAKKYAIMYLTGQGDAGLSELIGKDVRYLGAGRDKTKITPRQSFYV
jgi:hypothetical protein